MKAYGLPRVIMAPLFQLAKRSAQLARGIVRQRRIIVGKNVRLAFDVSVFGTGRVILGDNVVVENGVIFRAEQGARIEVGSGARLGRQAELVARAGHSLVVGARFRIGARSSIHSVAGLVWGSDGSLGEDAFVGPREGEGAGRLRVGDRTRLHDDNLIDLCGDVSIGDDVHSGPGCSIYTHNHVPMRGALVWAQPPAFSAIVIGSGVWLGHGCSILPGSSIGDNSVVATSAVVTMAVPEWSIAGGVPARVLKTIGPEAPLG